MIRHADSLIIAWKLAALEARHTHDREIQPVHFFLGLLKAVDVDVTRLAEAWQAAARDSVEHISADIAALESVFHAASIETTPLRRRRRQRLARGTDGGEGAEALRRSTASRNIFCAAECLGSKTVGPCHLLVALLESDVPEVSAVLADSGADSQTLIRNAKLAATAPSVDPPRQAPRRKVRNTLLESFGRDLTRLAKEGKLQPLIGRKNEIRELARVLVQSRKNNIILTGEAGVGKTGIVEGFAQRIASGEVAEEFRRIRIIEISMSSIVAGTTFRGDFEARFDALIKEASADPELVLFIDEIHLLIGAGQSAGGAMDAANILKPALARGEIRLIGATTTAEYRRFIEKDPALERRFQTLEISEPDRAEALNILSAVQPRLEERHGVTITTDALAAAVDLSIRYIPDRRLPDKALDIIDQACAQARLRSVASIRNPAKARIDDSTVAAVVSRMCGVPLAKITAKEKEQLLHLEHRLAERIKGQDAALASVADAIRIAKSGLRNVSKPLAVFLLAGPTGSGKTELAKAVAEIVFGDENRMVRIDMSEFMESHSGAKLIGSPPGYVGHEEGGQLTDQIRDNPYTVLLLDEIEKAHPKILDLFLQVFDEGTLKDSKGRKCDFRETIIFLTSNLGARSAAIRRVGFQDDSNAEVCSAAASLEDIKKAFRPELVNRLSGIVVFEPLNPAAVCQIIDKFIERLNVRMQSSGATILLEDSARDLLMAQGYSEAYGAREMERTIEALVAKPLARLVLEGNLPPDANIKVAAVQGQIVFS